MVSYKIAPSKVSGTTKVPPSKSHTMRALLFALMGRGESLIRNFLPSPDTMAMVKAISAFGAKVKVTDDCMVIEGRRGELCRPKEIIDAKNSGLVFRLMAGIGALLDSYVIITGDESIQNRRVIAPLLEALSSRGVFAKSAALDNHAPIIIRGPLEPGKIEIDGADSQPVSALLIATSFLQGGSEIYVTNPGEELWVQMTLDWLTRLGGEVTREGYSYYKVKGGLAYEGFDTTIAGDFSSSTYPLAAALLTKEEICLTGLALEDRQADSYFIELLEEMGATIEKKQDRVFLRKSKPLSGIVMDVNRCIDALPLLAVVATSATSPSWIRGGEIARYKESDRVSSVVEELRKMGAIIEEKQDGMVVYPSALKGAHLTSHKDHRIALSMIVASLAAEGESVIEDVEHIAKSYPDFFSEFTKLGAKIS